jgi:hypothetical protein
MSYANIIYAKDLSIYRFLHLWRILKPIPFQYQWTIIWREKERDKENYHKELAHKTVKSDKSKLCRAKVPT